MQDKKIHKDKFSIYLQYVMLAFGLICAAITIFAVFFNSIHAATPAGTFTGIKTINEVTYMSYGDFINLLQETNPNNIKWIQVKNYMAAININDKQYVTYLLPEATHHILQLISSLNLNNKLYFPYQTDVNILNYLFWGVVIYLLFKVVSRFLFASNNSSEHGVFSFGKINIKDNTGNVKITFKDVTGQNDAKQAKMKPRKI